MSISPAGLLETAISLEDELQDAFTRVMKSGWYVLGPEVAEFEREFAVWTGTQHAVGVASGTDALELALRALGIGEGDEVIVPANAVPTPYGVAASGASIVFADVREADYNIDPNSVRELITPRTRAVIAVHLYGHPADVPALREVIGSTPVSIVEDCAQAHGARLNGTPVGSLGDIAAWSFYPTKNLGAYGDGGAVTCGTETTAESLRSLRMYGEERRYYSPRLGVNSRLDELQAALLRAKLPYLDSWISRRREIAAQYDAALNTLVQTPPCLSGTDHARHLYPIRVNQRDEVLAALQEQGIPAAVHYPVGAHRQPCFDYAGASLPVTDALATSLLSLPMHPSLSDDDVSCIIQAVVDAVALQ